MREFRLAIGQMLSTINPQENLETMRQMVSSVAGEAHMVVFPEAAMAQFGADLVAIAEPTDGPFGRGIAALASEHNTTIVAGMFTPAENGRVHNTLIVVSPDGSTSSYNKIHLFDAYGYSESQTVAPGTQPTIVDVDGTTIGLATCYDIRFPPLFTTLANLGADIIVIPASWARGTGKWDQWTILARARALDSTTFIAAVDQADPTSVGDGVSGPTGIGGSIIVSPLGEIIDQLGPAPEVRIVTIDLDAVESARQSLPVLANARL